jgi:hypothetical protein
MTAALVVLPILATSGCMLRNLQGVSNHCTVGSARTQIEIQNDLSGTQTFRYFGVFSRDYERYRSGEPCEYSLSQRFADAQAELTKAGYTVERDGSRLVVWQKFPAEQPDPPSLKRLTLTVREVRFVLEAPQPAGS